jgi:hypothetical protein
MTPDPVLVGEATGWGVTSEGVFDPFAGVFEAAFGWSAWPSASRDLSSVACRAHPTVVRRLSPSPVVVRRFVLSAFAS